ncbi:MAG: DUF805 domain-containing protein [Gammaproteobacteria bacterium]
MESVNKFYLDVLKTKYATFEGRAGRQEFWMFTLFNIIVSIVLAVIDGILGLQAGAGMGILGTIYGLAVFVPSIALGCRRLHDVDKSGWLQLIALIPLIGVLILIFVYFIKLGTPGENQYGPNPTGM